MSLRPIPFIRPYLDPPIKVEAIALPVLHIEACPAVRLVSAALAQHRRQRQGALRLLRRAAPRQMAQPRDGASTGGATLEELPQKIIKHHRVVRRLHRSLCFEYDSHTHACVSALFDV